MFDRTQGIGWVIDHLDIALFIVTVMYMPGEMWVWFPTAVLVMLVTKYLANKVLH